MKIDSKGLKWIRSEDRLQFVCEDGRSVLCNEEMTDEYLLSVAETCYCEPPAIESQENRIQELEEQLKELLTKLSTK
jgi:hypothetical protein